MKASTSHREGGICENRLLISGPLFLPRSEAAPPGPPGGSPGGPGSAAPLEADLDPAGVAPSAPPQRMPEGDAPDGILLDPRVGGQIQGLQDRRLAAAVQAEEHGEGGQRDAPGPDPAEPADLDALSMRSTSIFRLLPVCFGRLSAQAERTPRAAAFRTSGGTAWGWPLSFRALRADPASEAAT